MECVCVYAVSSYCKPCYALSTAHIVWTNTVLVCMCCIVQGMCSDCYPLLVLRLPNDFLFNSEPKVARWTHCTSTGPPTAYWTSTWVGGAWNGVDVNMGGYGVVDESE